MADPKIEGLPPVAPPAPDVTEQQEGQKDDRASGRGRRRGTEGQGYDARDAAGSAPQTIKDGTATPTFNTGLDTPRARRPQAGQQGISKQDLDAARRELQARGLKGKPLDSCVSKASGAATTLAVPVKEVTQELVRLLAAVGPERWEFALEGFDSAVGWARKRGLDLSSVTDALVLLIVKEGPANAYDALADFVMVGVVTRDSRTPIQEATRALIAFLDVEGPMRAAVAQEELRLVCVAAKGASESFAALARELQTKLAAASPDARDEVRQSFAAAHRTE